MLVNCQASGGEKPWYFFKEFAEIADIFIPYADAASWTLDTSAIQEAPGFFHTKADQIIDRCVTGFAFKYFGHVEGTGDIFWAILSRDIFQYNVYPDKRLYGRLHIFHTDLNTQPSLWAAVQRSLFPENQADHLDQIGFTMK